MIGDRVCCDRVCCEKVVLVRNVSRQGCVVIGYVVIQSVVRGGCCDIMIGCVVIGLSDTSQCNGARQSYVGKRQGVFNKMC